MASEPSQEARVEVIPAQAKVTVEVVDGEVLIVQESVYDDDHIIALTLPNVRALATALWAVADRVDGRTET